MAHLLCFGILLALTISAEPRGGRKAAPRPNTAPGSFAYYVLSLSWSPQFCSTPNGQRDDLQCGGTRRFFFVAHGLWPQNERGFPENCGAAPGPSQQAITAMLDIMPSPRLVAHEWEKHGTCSGLAAQKYLETIRRAYDTMKIPAEFKQPLKQVQVSPAKLKQRFIDVNSLAGGNSLAVLCSGRFLSEVRVCLTKDLKSRACGPDVRDRCSVDQLIMQPLR